MLLDAYLRCTSDEHLPSQDFRASPNFRRVQRGLAYDFFRFLKRPQVQVPAGPAGRSGRVGAAAGAGAGSGLDGLSAGQHAPNILTRRQFLRRTSTETTYAIRS